MQTLSYVLSALGLASVVVASLIKGRKMKQILFLVFSSNVLFATSYLFAGSGINGAASCFLGALQAIITYFFDSKNKPLPKWLVALYALGFVAVNLIFGGFNGMTVLAIVASLSFVMCIGQKNGAKYRFWTIVNSVLWCIYDLLSKSYGALVSHIILLIFTVVGMIIHDRKKEKVNE